jgi:small subunit ribosomal protein S9
MADEEKQEETTPEEPTAQEPEAEAPAEEAVSEEAPPEEAPVVEEAPSSEEAEEPAAEASDEVAEAAAEPAAASAPEPAGDVAEGKASGAVTRDLPPGAELEPISLEPSRPMDAEERARVEAEAEERARIEAEATADGGEEPLARTAPRVEIPADALIQATGKRKNAIARVVVRSGSGRFEVNKRPLEEFFPRAHLQTVARQALVTCGYEGNVDVAVRVHGGGVSGQAGAIRHGIARALCEIDVDLRPELKRRGFLTRDARIKERRKAGLKKARKRPQFSKR